MTAPVAVPWAVLDGLREYLSVIRKANGYRTDLGTTVQTELWDGTGKPRMVVVAGEITITSQTSSQRIRSMQLYMQLELPADAGNAQQTAHAMIEDVLDAFPSKQVHVPTPVGSCGVEITGTRILNRPDGAQVVVAVVDGRVNFASKHATPEQP